MEMDLEGEREGRGGGGGRVSCGLRFHSTSKW